MALSIQKKLSLKEINSIDTNQAKVDFASKKFHNQPDNIVYPKHNRSRVTK